MIGAILQLVGGFGLNAQKGANDQYLLYKANSNNELGYAVSEQNKLQTQSAYFTTIFFVLGIVGLIAILLVIVFNSKK